MNFSDHEILLAVFDSDFQVEYQILRLPSIMPVKFSVFIHISSSVMDLLCNPFFHFVFLFCFLILILFFSLPLPKRSTATKVMPLDPNPISSSQRPLNKDNQCTQ